MPENEKQIKQEIGSIVESMSNEAPDWLPLKFWDAKNGEIRIQALAKSYKLLEKRLSSKSAEKLIEEPVDKLVDKSVDEPVDSVVEDVVEVVDNSSDVLDLSAVELALERAFGGAEKWQKLRPQLLSWGRHNLPEAAFLALSGSIEGIQALYRMMLSSQSSEPRLVEGGDLPHALDDSRLRRMMEDPRYWRERDPEFVRRVLRGFQQLYGG